MIWRFASFLLLQLVCAAAGAWLASALAPGLADVDQRRLWWLAGAAIGFCIATWVGFAIDAYRAERLLNWLRSEEAPARDAPSMRGVWGETADRMRRRLRAAERRGDRHQERVRGILSALQASPNGVMLLDDKMHIEWCNQPAASHFGVDPDRDALQALGNLVRDPALAAYIARQDFARDVVIAGRNSSNAHPVRVSIQLHRYGEGRILLLSRDVTAVEQADAMRRDFVANVSHEIRTPLTVLAGFVETLQSLALAPEEQSRYLNLMRQQANRMQALVDDLLTLSRLEGGPLPGTADEVDLGKLLSRCEDEALLLSSLLGRGHTFDFPQPASVALLGAATELHSALANLLGNAIRYTPAGGSIGVDWSVQRIADSALAVSYTLSVRDTGPGIAPEHLPRLTERFYRMDRSRSRDTGGTGLGLAIVKHVMQRHGGQLRIDTREGVGSVFSLVFPAQRVQADGASDVLVIRGRDAADASNHANAPAVTASAAALATQKVAGFGHGPQPPQL